MPLPLIIAAAVNSIVNYLPENKEEMTSNRRRNLKKWFEDNEIPPEKKSFISQLINGKSSFGESAARKLEEDFSMPRFFLDLNESAFINKDSLKDVTQENFSQTDSIKLELLDNHLSAGNGVINLDYPDAIRSIEFSRDKFMEIFQRKNANNLSIAIIDGNSMYNPQNPEMSLKHGDIVAIDKNVNEFKDDGIYAFVYEGKARIKRLQYLSGYRLKVISDNPSYDPEILEKDQVEQIHFVGKLIKKLTLDIVDL